MNSQTNTPQEPISVNGVGNESTSCTPDYLQNGCTRAEALRTGQLYDFTHAQAAQNGHFGIPVALTAKLWQTLAGDRAFSLADPLLLQFSRAVAAAVVRDRYDRRQQGFFSETVWFHVPLAGQRLHLKLVCHPGDTAAPVLTLLDSSETTQFEL